MSRIGNRIIKVPENINVIVHANHVSISNGTNKLEVNYKPFNVKVILENNTLQTKSLNASKDAKMQVGTINALLNNAITGLVSGFSKTLKITGVGYKAALNNDQLNLALGYSHPISLKIPPAIKVTLTSPTEIKLTSFNKELLGEFSANIRQWRKPEPYKGKGIAYHDEFILRKVGKTSEGGKK